MSRNRLNLNNQEYIDSLYRQYQENPSSVDHEWQAFFEGFDFGFGHYIPTGIDGEGEAVFNSLRICRLIEHYRRFSYLGAHNNPLTERPPKPKELELSSLGFRPEEEALVFPSMGILAAKEAPLKDIIAKLDQKYLGSISVEAFNLNHPELEDYIHKRIIADDIYSRSKEEKKLILQEIGEAQLFEEYLQKKFTGAKRFSLEGSEATVPFLAELLRRSAKNGVKKACIGMAHRGRLNVLTHIMKKPYDQIFDEFSPEYFVEWGQGDVKYHKGARHVMQYPDGKQLELVLAANPSHLEAVDPVALGIVRAYQQELGDENGDHVLPIQIHGDAAVSGQGVVYEMMQLYKIDGYSTGGAIQLIINNQIGYTATPEQYKSMRSASDIAKTFNMPIFQVNGDDVEAVAYLAALAHDIRLKFKTNVMINLHGFRKYGHNEGDEPRFTQPLLYKKLKNIDTSYVYFQKKLMREGVIDQAFIDAFEEKCKNTFDQSLEKSKEHQKKRTPPTVLSTDTSVEKTSSPKVETKIEKEKALELGIKLSSIPENFDAHPKIKKLYQERKEYFALASDEPFLDWATGELLAYASLLDEGFDVRISGQDSVRGTFSHRHAKVYCQSTNESFAPLDHIHKTARFQVYNSILSEYAVMGFEYGFSLANPNAFVMWEGQFGDFANGAQIIIDQFLSSSKTKWNEASSMTLFLPHGVEAMGPEHSSARLERFLLLAADNNLRICNFTTPAQVFHAFRRQKLMQDPAPLIVMSPKQLLRYKPTFSKLSSITDKNFEEIIDDPNASKDVKRLIFCSGRIYYDLAERREKENVKDLAIVRLEQIYPVDREGLKAIASRYPKVKNVFWVQEEHYNQGAWSFILPYLQECFEGSVPVEYIGRVRRASPAAGSVFLHNKEQEAVIYRAMTRGLTS